MIEYLENVKVARDDTSCFGLRRLHLLSSKPMDAERVLRGVMAEGGEISAWYKWVDPKLGDYHLYVAWRYKMLGPSMWAVGVDGTLDNTIQRAVVGYRKRVNKMPNRAILRRDIWDQDGHEIEMQDEKGEKLGKITIVAVDTGWQESVVGVWFDGDGGGHEETTEERQAMAV